MQPVFDLLGTVGDGRYECVAVVGLQYSAQLSVSKLRCGGKEMGRIWPAAPASSS